MDNDYAKIVEAQARLRNELEVTDIEAYSLSTEPRPAFPSVAGQIDALSFEMDQFAKRFNR